MSITPAAIRAAETITTIHFEGKRQTATIPTPRAMQTMPAVPILLLPFFFFKKKYLPVMNVHHIIRSGSK